jgi:ABC-type multidrug transport system fused ATPase/permease subunit
MKDNELSKLLQKHEVIDQADLDQLTERINSMITKKTLQVRRIRWAVLIAWVLFMCFELFGGRILASQHLVAQAILFYVAWILLLISVVLTISWYVRSVDLRFERVQAALSRIQEALDDLVKQSTRNPQN